MTRGREKWELKSGKDQEDKIWAEVKEWRGKFRKIKRQDRKWERNGHMRMTRGERMLGNWFREH